MASSETKGDSDPVNGAGDEPFWRRLALEEMSSEQWESLCDGCGRCCLNKLEDEDTGEISWTTIRCRLLDETVCRCIDYDNRSAMVPDCVRLTPQNVRTLSWLPPSCAYRRLAEGNDLCWWHPLVSGEVETVHLAGISVRGRTECEQNVPLSKWEEFIVDWPTVPPGDC
ncbi:MAG: YcgN family cysteine cluster protein [Alphaproteobacteria bacterium]